MSSCELFDFFGMLCGLWVLACLVNGTLETLTECYRNKKWKQQQQELKRSKWKHNR